MKKFTAQQAAAWCGGRLYGPDVDICRMWRSDSRDVAPCDAFVAIRGERTDGHIYIDTAIERGAKLILLEDSQVEPRLLSAKYANVAFIAVDDTTKALAQMARGYLMAVSPHVVGITGSVGKTTTRELSAAVLGRKYKVHCAIRSFNTIIGCSLTVLSMPADTEVLLLELGTNHFGEIREMVSYFPPETAVITDVAPAHLEGFGSVEGVLRAKSEICESVRPGCVIYNADNALLQGYMKSHHGDFELCSVGRTYGADLKAVSAHITFNDSGPWLGADYESEHGQISVNTPLFGIQHVYNAGYAVALGRRYGVPDEDIANAMACVVALGGRGVCKKTGRNTWVVDEAYNANPSSMGAAVDNIIEVAQNGVRCNMFAVLGGMRELGETSPVWHNEILNKVTQFKEVLLLGDEWFDAMACGNIPECAKCFRSFEEVVHRVKDMDMSNGVLLIKGSNSYGLGRLVSILVEERI